MWCGMAGGQLAGEADQTIMQLSSTIEYKNMERQNIKWKDTKTPKHSFSKREKLL
jgi:hypothetical protein